MAKATKAEMERRTDEIYDLIINRVSYRAIVGYAASKWGVKERQVAVYMDKAKKRIAELARPSQEEQLAKAIASYESLYARQVAEKDFSGARQTLDSLVRLLGLSAPEKQELTATLAVKGYIGLDLEGP